MGLEVHEVTFPSVDGFELQGWLLAGDPELPPIVLCHDWGDSKEGLIPLALELSERRFPLLLFDFRGHGASEGHGSTLGADEGRDVLGALDYARGIGGSEQRRLGLYGVGMGAHAAVLQINNQPSRICMVIGSQTS